MDIMVSVFMTVYNHERYLKQAIEGVLMQKTTFRYELIIGEDCSTDGSREIVVAYQKRYPDVIRAILNPVNLGMDKNGWKVTEAAKGRYIAICEGDDYWTDPDKLQIQVEFLEANPEYSGCYHSVDIVDEDGNPRDIGVSSYIFQEDSDYTKKDWQRMPLPGQSGSLVMRNLYKTMSSSDYLFFRNTRCNGDMKIPILLLTHGKIRRMGRNMSCYRRTYIGSSWNARTKGKDMRLFLYISWVELGKLVVRLWNVVHFPYESARGCLYSIIQDVIDNGRDEKQFLKRIICYDISFFLFLLPLIDVEGILNGREYIFLDTLTELDISDLSDIEYIVFGTGDMAEGFYKFAYEVGLQNNIVSVWDNDIKKIGDTFHKIPIETPSYSVLSKKTRIIISSRRYYDEMLQQLMKMGYVNDQIWCFSDMVTKKYLKRFYKKFCNIYIGKSEWCS